MIRNKSSQDSLYHLDHSAFLDKLSHCSAGRFFSCTCRGQQQLLVGLAATG